jgi:CheY-like chemotaxis protein
MNDNPRRMILLVDDEPNIRETFAALLREEGYEVSTAVHGFDALLNLRHTTPDLIISDLNMPQMSGFEFLAVLRRRFPSIPVIAMSGGYDSCDCFPGGVMADRFYGKGRCHSEELLSAVSELLLRPVTRKTDHQLKRMATQIPRHGTDPRGAPFILITCTDCLRSFSLSYMPKSQLEEQEANCQFCATSIRFVNDFSLHLGPQRAQTESLALSASHYY